MLENFSSFYNSMHNGLFQIATEHQFSKRLIIESVDSISRDERDVPLTQYITNA